MSAGGGVALLKDVVHEVDEADDVDARVLQDPGGLRGAIMEDASPCRTPSDRAR